MSPLRPLLVALSIAVGALLLTFGVAALALADTAAPPTSQDTNNVLLAIVALGALSAVVVLTRPRKPGSR